MTDAARVSTGGTAGDTDIPMSHRQVLEALSGLLVAMFVAILSGTIVANALPTIAAELHADETVYTWIITTTLLAVTVSTPLWGKLADLFNKKLLIQLSLVIFICGSMFAALTQNVGMLITARAVQGIGVGGLTALSQVIMAAMIPPRERGRYSGYLGAVFAVGTVGGPLIGGVIVDTPWLGWRWCFCVGVPFSLIAMLVLQRTLRLPTTKRAVKVDWLGALLITAAVSLLLIWVSFAGHDYDWLSWQTAAMVGGSLVLGALFVLAERTAKEPILPLRLFAVRTISLSSFASLFIGAAMFGSSTFLVQYFQLARGETPTVAGLLTLPMIIGLALSSTISGRIITRTGRWKGFLVAGAITLAAGMGLMGTMRYDTAYWVLALFMFCTGVGVGMTQQNLVLAVQNQVRLADLGAASSLVAFLRSMGGAVGVSVLGAVLSHRVGGYLREGLAALGVKAGATAMDGSIPDLSALPAPIRTVVQSAFGHAIADLFLFSAPAVLVALLAIFLIKEVPLRTTIAHTAEREPAPSTNGFRPWNGAQATAQPASADGIGPADGARPADGSRPANGTRPGSADGTGPGHHGEVTQGERRGR